MSLDASRNLRPGESLFVFSIVFAAVASTPYSQELVLKW
jgi:hypothetical protein